MERRRIRRSSFRKIKKRIKSLLSQKKKKRRRKIYKKISKINRERDNKNATKRGEQNLKLFSRNINNTDFKKGETEQQQKKKSKAHTFC